MLTIITAAIGFQLVFSSAVSVVRIYNIGDLKGEDILFYLGLAIVGGGILSHILIMIVQKFGKEKTDKILVMAIVLVTIQSAIARAASIGVNF